MSGSDDLFTPEGIAAAGEYDAGKERKDETNLKPPPIAPVLEGCAWLRHCKDEQATVSEPEWYAMLSIVSRCEGGEGLIHEFSDKHPGYNFAETARKADQARDRSGPRTCRYIRERFGAAQCEQCRFGQAFKWGGSPILLGRDSVRVDPGDDFAEPTQAHANYPTRPLTDLGNAELMTDLYGSTMRYVPNWGSWLLWNGRAWEKDADGCAARRTARRSRWWPNRTTS